MPTVIISPKYHVVIPKVIREALQLRPGHQFNIFAYDGRIIMIPEKDIADLKGFLKGINVTFKRENGRI